MQRVLRLWGSLTGLLKGKSNLLKPALQDLGTICLGAAAIFLTRAFPASGDFSFDMMFASTVLAVAGIVLRFLSSIQN